MYLTDDAGSLPPALEDSTSLKAAGQRRDLRTRLPGWAGSAEARELPRRDRAASGP